VNIPAAFETLRFRHPQSFCFADGRSIRLRGNQKNIDSAADTVVPLMNFYVANSRNHRINVQVINLSRSSVSSTFGYYVGGQ
jgi:hypothetical protein